jgi:hypothetical protein
MSLPCPDRVPAAFKNAGLELCFDKRTNKLL